MAWEGNLAHGIAADDSGGTAAELHGTSPLPELVQMSIQFTVHGKACQWNHVRFRVRESAILPVRLAFFDQRAQSLLRIFQAIKLVEKDIHGVLESIAERETHSTQDGFFGHGQHRAGVAGHARDQIVDGIFEVGLETRRLTRPSSRARSAVTGSPRRTISSATFGPTRKGKLLRPAVGKRRW